MGRLLGRGGHQRRRQCEAIALGRPVAHLADADLADPGTICRWLCARGGMTHYLFLELKPAWPASLSRTPRRQREAPGVLPGALWPYDQAVPAHKVLDAGIGEADVWSGWVEH